MSENLPTYPAIVRPATIEMIKQWRAAQNARGSVDGLDDFFCLNDICAYCLGRGSVCCECNYEGNYHGTPQTRGHHWHTQYKQLFEQTKPD